MKRKQMSAVVLGLAWLASLGAVFVLGILSAFAFHLGPGAASETVSNLTLDQRGLMLTIERYTGEPADIARLMSVTDDTAVPEQLEQALRAILRLNDPEQRLVAVVNLVRGLPARRVLGAIRFLQEIPSGPARDQLLQAFLETWGQTDGRSAMAFATTVSSSRERQLAIGAVLRGWSRSRPSDAWNWVIEREGSSRRAERWLEVILSSLGLNDRETALMLIGRLPSENFQERMSLAVMDQILQAEPPREALSWLGELPDNAQGAAAAFLAQRWAQTEPEAAAAWLLDAFPGQTGGLREVLREWVYASPKVAADWVWESFSGTRRANLMDVVAEEWVANDGPTPLAQWLNARGPDPALDGAIEALALATADVDPATALVWAQSVNDPDARSMLEIVIGREYIRQSPDAAAENLPLLLESESARAALLEPGSYPLEEEYGSVDDTGIEPATEPMELEPPPPPQQ